MGFYAIYRSQRVKLTFHEIALKLSKVLNANIKLHMVELIRIIAEKISSGQTATFWNHWFLFEAYLSISSVIIKSSEVKGRPEHHEFELDLQIGGIAHSKTQVRGPQSHEICECLHCTMQEEFYAVAFRKKLYTHFRDLQLDLDEWMKFYNTERCHNGRYCFGKTPIYTFKESINLARRKIIGQLTSAA